MSGATESLGRRIAGAKDLSSVVRSMKALAASSIAQYERAIDALHGYTRTVESGLSVCLRELAPLEHLAAEPQCLARGAILFGSDQGLVGRFNESLVDFAVDTLKALPGATTELWSVGERMAELVAGSSLPPPTPLTVPHSVEAIAPLVSQMLIAITTARVRGQVGEIYVFHNRQSGDMGYEPISKRLLPLDEVWQRDILARPWPTKALPEVLGSTRSTLEGLIRGHLFVALFQACAQSLASENASRLAAMQRAQDNIARILDGLSRTFHRLRQESIDEELFDVVSGYESLTRRGRVTEL